MKKLLLILFAVMFVANISAQEQPTNINLTSSEYVWRSGKNFYCGDQLLTKKEYKYFLQNTCPRAFGQYQKGDRLMKAGWTFFGLGAASFTMGAFFFIPSDSNLDLAAVLFNTPITGMCWAIGIPMLCVGYRERDRSTATYNMLCQGEPPITYNITASQNGIGFAINF